MEQAVELFVAMGYQKAGDWSKEKMERKLLTISDAAADCPDLENAELNDLLDELLGSEDVITLEGKSPSITDAHDQTEEEAEEVKEEKPKNKKKKKGKKSKKDKKDKKKDKAEEVKKEDKPKKAKSKASSVKPPTRVGITSKYIMSCGQPVTIKEIVKGGDALYAQSGGSSNEKEALYAARLSLQALEAIGVVVNEDGTYIVK